MFYHGKCVVHGKGLSGSLLATLSPDNAIVHGCDVLNKKGLRSPLPSRYFIVHKSQQINFFANTDLNRLAVITNNASTSFSN